MKFRTGRFILFFILFDFLWGLALQSADGGAGDYFLDYFSGNNWFGLLATNMLSFFLYSLSAYFFLWYFGKKSDHRYGYIPILLCLVPIILFRYALQEMFAPAFLGFHNYHNKVSLAYYISDNKYYAIYYTGFGILFYYLQSTRYKDYIQQELQIQNRQAELDYLKSQINPHFLFNSLNNIYSLIYSKSDNALAAIEKLSGLMRYILYEKKGKVPLAEEVNYLHNFIDLQKLRYDYVLPLSVLIDIPADAEIAPLLLIPPVENACKHGNFTDPEMPLTINLLVKNRKLYFEVKNKKGKHQQRNDHGIGIANLKRRVELLYPHKHSITIQETETVYHFTLEIDLS
ncbi:MAG: sensor histidine kinase [Ferruginibacter sp.]|nr:sensor histidine kinase [Ferruginibacter sp.]